MTTLTATTAAEQLLADVRQLLARHDGAETVDELRELADALTTALRRVRGRINRLAKKDEAAPPAPVAPAAPTSNEPAPNVAPTATAAEPTRAPPTTETQPVSKPTQPANTAKPTEGTTAVTHPPQPYPQHPPPPTVEPRNGYGITALVLAIIGLVFGLVPLTGFIALILGALAVVFAFLGRGRIKRRTATNKGMTVFGGLLGVGAIALGVWGMSIVFGAVDELNRDLEQIDQEFERDMDELDREMEKLDPPK